MRTSFCAFTVAVGFLTVDGIERQAHAAPRQSCDGPSYVETHCVGAELPEYALFVQSDDAGRIITGGEWHGFEPGYVVDFDPTDGVDEKVGFGGDDVYVSVTHADGSYTWTNTFGGDGDEDLNDLAIGANGRIFVAGSFFRRFGDDPVLVDFDPGPGEDIHECPSDSVCSFVTRYEPDGSYLGTWSNGAEGKEIIASQIEFDVFGNMFIAGYFRGGPFDFDPTEGEDLHRAGVFGRHFLTKMLQDGTYAWTIEFEVSIRRVKLDSHGDLYITGSFDSYHKYDFDPGPGKDRRGGDNLKKVFVTRLNADLSYGWTRMVAQSDENLQVYDMDNDGDDILIAGYFYDHVIFNPDGEPDYRSDPDNGTAWLVKLDTRGRYQWVYAIPSDDGSSSARGVSADRHGSVYLSGSFGGQTNFDPDGEGDWHFGGGNASMFVTKLGADRSYQWTRVVGGSGSMYPWNIKAASDGRLLISGGFYSPRGVDFNPTDGEDIRHDNGVEDAFVTTWLCSDCDALQSHGLSAKPRGSVISRVTTNLTGGRVKVQLTFDLDTVAQTGRIRTDGRVRTRFDGLSPGRYDVQIQWIEDENGARLCDGPLMERSAGVP
ncbi:MAG: hypothetical protein BroJett003_23010 [Planctomycetota bacterium]|nr:MAG: hypothetical protein BroJett003_23010 [Planctomycetota bacterium]